MAAELEAADRFLATVVRRQPSTPSAKLHRKELGLIVRRELATWGPADRELFELRFFAGLRPAEIVEVLGLADEPNTISKRLERLMTRFRAALQKRDPFTPA
jgi:DNA-directed RNA polymerase specialized sigma24 family protein